MLPFGNPEDILFSWTSLYFICAVALIFCIRGYVNGRPCVSEAKLKGKTVIITGANSGIGFETAKDLARRGGRVILACRDEKKGEDAVKDIKNLSKKYDVKYMNLDLESFASIRKFVKEFNESEEKLNILINNAGVMMAPGQKTIDGNELHLQVNFLGHFLLTKLLLDKLKGSSPSRIICLSATSYKLGALNFEDLNLEKPESDYTPGKAYSNSKLAVVLWVKHLSKLLDGSDVTVNTVHPGIVHTGAMRFMPFSANAFLRISLYPFTWLLMKDAKSGAQTSIHCAVAEEIDKVTGKYFAECEAADLDEVGKDDQVADKLWRAATKMTKTN